MQYRYYGTLAYQQALELMEKKRDEAVQQKNVILMGMQHPLVFTAGLMTKDEHVIEKNIHIHKARRGGSVTLHNAGQLVIYMLVPLQFTKGLAAFIRMLEKTLLQTFSHFDNNFFLTPPHSGIWTPRGKIAFIGLGVKKQCIYHGIGINLFNDLSPFKKIFSCGLELPVARLCDFDGKLQHTLQEPQTQEEALKTFAQQFFADFKNNL